MATKLPTVVPNYRRMTERELRYAGSALSQLDRIRAMRSSGPIRVSLSPDPAGMTPTLTYTGDTAEALFAFVEERLVQTLTLLDIELKENAHAPSPRPDPVPRRTGTLRARRRLQPPPGSPTADA